MSDYLKPDEVLEILGCSRTTLYRWREKGTGPAYVRMPNGRYLYPRSEFTAWVSEHLHIPEGSPRTKYRPLTVDIAEKAGA